MTSKPTNAEVDFDTLTYVLPPPQSLTCPVCRCVFSSPLQTRCKHIFCERCITRALEDKLECPIDRVQLTNGLEDCETPPRIVQQLIDELKVVCPNVGCGMTIERGSLHWHLRDTCEYVLVPCTACSLPTIKQYADKCEHKEIVCEHCLQGIRQSEMQDHIEQCSELSHRCVYCALEMNSIDMREHQGSCLEEIVECEARKIGCNWSDRRAVLARHTSICALHNLRPFLAIQIARIEELELKNRSLGEQVVALQNAPKEEPVFEISSEYERDRTYLFQSLENLSSSVESLTSSLHNIDARQSRLANHEAMRTQEELAHIRVGMQNIRLQWHHFVQSTRGPLNFASPPPRNDMDPQPLRVSPTRQTSDGSKVKL